MVPKSIKYLLVGTWALAVCLTIIFLLDLKYDQDHWTWVWGVSALIVWMRHFANMVILAVRTQKIHYHNNRHVHNS